MHQHNRRQVFRLMVGGLTAAAGMPFLRGAGDPPTAITKDPYKPIYRYDDALEAVYQDQLALTKEHPDKAYDARYIALSGIHPDEYFLLVQAILFTYNSLSKNVQMLPAYPVEPKGRVLRISLKDAGISSTAWENLGKFGGGPLRIARPDKAFPEPYWHVQDQFFDLEKVDPYVHTDGHTYEYKKVAKLITKHAPELDQAKVAKVVRMCGSDFPIVRGDWFVANALFAPIYYELLGAKDLKDLQKIARYHAKDNVDLEMAGTVIDSHEVSHNNRTLLRGRTALKYWYETFDYLTSIDENDLLLNVLLAKRGKVEKSGKKRFRDAGEIIFTLPNGLQGYGLVDGEDKLVAFADPNVVADRKTHFKHKVVFTGFSCITCHDKGLKEVTDEVRLVTDVRKNIKLLSINEKDQDLVFQLFQQNFDEALREDQTYYAKAVFASNGLSSEDNAANIARIVIGYHQDQLTMQEVAVNCCYSPEHCRKALALGIGIDPRLSNALQNRGIRRDNFEATAFHHALQLCQLLDREQRAGNTWESLMKVRVEKLKELDEKRRKR